VGSIRWNRLTWGNVDNWSLGGDSWDFHAQFCNQPYEVWRDSVVKEFLTPYLGPRVDVVEIGPGQGRWSQFIVENARTVALVDLSANCIDACRRRFADIEGPEMSFFVNDGTSIPVADASVDLVWSFGTFVHIDLTEIDLYLAEVRRVLRPGGLFVIHHPGRNVQQRQPRFDRARGAGENLASVAKATGQSADTGLRSEVSAREFSDLVARHDLLLDRQVRSWGPRCEFAVAFEDVITIGHAAPS
jgi:SAM-dependent methyltransferase